jgi:hypothetical protein
MKRARPRAEPFTVQLAGLTNAEGKLLICKAFYRSLVFDYQARS